MGEDYFAVQDQWSETGMITGNIVWDQVKLDEYMSEGLFSHGQADVVQVGNPNETICLDVMW